MNLTDRLVDSLTRTVPDDAWPAPGDILVVAASGGPDSTALALLLQQLNAREGRGWRLHLAHLNHGLRGPQSDADARFVEDLARRHRWNVTVETEAVKEHAEREQLTLEEAARNRRYAFFRRVLEDIGAVVVATAHHADDNAETILQRLLRGTGFRGLAGIPVVRPLHPGSPQRVIRPLLQVRRDDITAFLDQQGVETCHDHTNELLEPTRNRLRNELIPELQRQYNPAVREALLRLGEQARWIDDHLQAAAEEALQRVVLDAPTALCPGQTTLDAGRLLKEPRIVQTEVLRRAFDSVGAGLKKLTFEHLLSVVELATRNVSGKHLQLPGGVRVSYDRGLLIVERVQRDA